MKQRTKMNIKKGDQVQIISGKDKGKVGTVNQIMEKKNSLIIENINIKIKHIKSKQTEQSGKIQKIEKPIHRSNVKLYTESS